MEFMILLIVFIVFPVVLGEISYLSTPARYHAVMKKRRVFKKEEYFIYVLFAVYICLVMICDLLMYVGKISKTYEIFSISIFSIIVIAILGGWFFNKFKCFSFIEKHWKVLSLVLGSITFLFGIYINEAVNAIIVQTTKYHASEFLVSQSSISVIITILFGFMLSLVILTFSVYVVMFVFIAKSLRGDNKLAKILYAIFRLLTFKRIAKLKVEKAQHAFLIGLTACSSIILATIVLAKASHFVVNKIGFENIIVDRLIESAYFSSPEDCENLEYVDGLRVAILTRDRLSLYVKGADPEFSKAVCISEPSNYIKITK